MEQDVFSVVGYQFGRFMEKDGPHKGEMKDYASLFVVQPMTGEQSERFNYIGSKALKFQCADASVLDKLEPGMKVNLYFDSKERVSLVHPVSPAK